MTSQDERAHGVTPALKQDYEDRSIQIANALSLPFEDDTFDAAFENNVFTHLAHDAPRAAREVYRVLKPGGIFAARDVNVDAVVWGHLTDPLKQLDRLLIAWQ